MPLAFLRRHRFFIAGLLALGAICPAAFAKKPGCSLKIWTPTERITFIKGGVFKESRWTKTIAERRLMYVDAFSQQARPELEPLGTKGLLGYSASFNSFGTRRRWLRFEMQLPHDQEARLPKGKRRMLVQYINQQQAQTFEFASSGNNFDHYLEDGVLPFGALEGIVRVFVYFDEMPDPPGAQQLDDEKADQAADLLFTFSASDLNLGYAYTSEVLKRSKAMRAKKGCKPIVYRSPIRTDCFRPDTSVDTSNRRRPCWPLDPDPTSRK
ncbi:MAG: hypothetical protein AAGH57_13620 [Pseudomonadota bacterium]